MRLKVIALLAIVPALTLATEPGGMRHPPGSYLLQAQHLTCQRSRPGWPLQRTGEACWESLATVWGYGDENYDGCQELVDGLAALNIRTRYRCVPAPVEQKTGK